MTSFEYVSVLLSIVMSLALAHLTTGVARLIKARGVKFSLSYAGWYGLIAFGCIDYWFSLWQAHTDPTWTLAYVLFWLVMAMSNYIMAWLVAPPEGDLDGFDLVAFHNSDRRRYLGAVFVYTAIGAIQNLTTPSLHSAVYVSLSVMVLIAIAWTWGNQIVQWSVLAIMYLVIGWYARAYISVL